MNQNEIFQLYNWVKKIFWLVGEAISEETVTRNGKQDAVLRLPCCKCGTNTCSRGGKSRKLNEPPGEDPASEQMCLQAATRQRCFLGQSQQHNAGDHLDHGVQIWGAAGERINNDQGQALHCQKLGFNFRRNIFFCTNDFQNSNLPQWSELNFSGCKNLAHCTPISFEGNNSEKSWNWHYNGSTEAGQVLERRAVLSQVHAPHLPVQRHLHWLFHPGKNLQQSETDPWKAKIATSNSNASGARVARSAAEGLSGNQPSGKFVSPNCPMLHLSFSSSEWSRLVWKIIWNLTFKKQTVKCNKRTISCIRCFGRQLGDRKGRPHSQLLIPSYTCE